MCESRETGSTAPWGVTAEARLGQRQAVTGPVLRPCLRQRLPENPGSTSSPLTPRSLWPAALLGCPSSGFQGAARCSAFLPEDRVTPTSGPSSGFWCCQSWTRASVKQKHVSARPAWASSAREQGTGGAAWRERDPGCHPQACVAPKHCWARPVSGRRT